MPIQTPGQKILEEAIFNAFFTPAQEGLQEITDKDAKEKAEDKARANIEKISKDLATAIDNYITDTIVIIKSGIPVSIKTDKTTGDGKTVGTSTTGEQRVKVEVSPTIGRGETIDEGTS